MSSSCCNNNVITFQAIHSYKGNTSKGQLSFKKGDILVCDAAHVSENNKTGGGWLWGSISTSGSGASSTAASAGWFPPKFVQMVSSHISSRAAAVDDVDDDPFAGLPLLTSTTATPTDASVERVEEERTVDDNLQVNQVSDENSIIATEIATTTTTTTTTTSSTVEVNTIQSPNTTPVESTVQDKDDEEEFGDFDGGIQVETLIQSPTKEATIIKNDLNPEQLLELPSPDKVVTCADSFSNANGGQKNPPSLPFVDDTAAAPEANDATNENVVPFANTLSFTTTADQQSRPQLTRYDYDSDGLTPQQQQQQQPSATLLGEDDVMDDNLETSSLPSNINATKGDEVKIPPFELPSPEKLGIFIQSVVVGHNTNGIKPEIPYLDDEPADIITKTSKPESISLGNDEIANTDAINEPSSSISSKKFMRFDSSISKPESFHSVRESFGTTAEDSSEDLNNIEQQAEEGKPVITSAPGHFFDAVEDEDEFYDNEGTKTSVTSTIIHLNNNNNNDCNPDVESNQKKQNDSILLSEGEQHDEDEFGDFDGNVFSAKYELSLTASDDFGSFDGGFGSSPTAGHPNNDSSILHDNNFYTLTTAVVEDNSLRILETRSTNPDRDANDELNDKFPPNSLGIMDDNKSDKIGTAGTVMISDNIASVSSSVINEKSNTDSATFVAQSPLIQEEPGEGTVFGEFVDKGSFDETLETQPKEMLHIPLSDALLSMKQQPKGDEHGDEVIFGEFSNEKESKEEKTISGEVSVDEMDGVTSIRKPSMHMAFELPSPEKLGYFVETTEAHKETLSLPFLPLSQAENNTEVEEYSSSIKQKSDLINGDEDNNGTAFGEFFDEKGMAGNMSRINYMSGSGQNMDGDAPGDKISINDDLKLPSPDKLGYYAEKAGSQFKESLQLPFSVASHGSPGKKIDEPEFDGNQFVLDEIDEGIDGEVPTENSSGASDIRNIADTLRQNNNDNFFNFQSPEELDHFVETTTARLKDTLRLPTTTSVVPKVTSFTSVSDEEKGVSVEQLCYENEKYVCDGDSDDGFGEFSDGLVSSSINADSSKSGHPGTFGLSDFSEPPRHEINSPDNLNINVLQSASTKVYTTEQTSATTAAMASLGTDAVEVVCAREFEDQSKDFGGFQETFDGGKFSAMNLCDSVDGKATHSVVAKITEEFRNPLSSDKVEGKPVEADHHKALAADEVGPDLPDRQHIHHVTASAAAIETFPLRENKTNETPDDTEFGDFNSTGMAMVDSDINFPIDPCAFDSPPQFCAVHEDQDLFRDLNNPHTEYPEKLAFDTLESSAVGQPRVNQALKEDVADEFEEFGDFGDFGSAAAPQGEIDASVQKLEIDDIEFGDFADFDDPKQDMPQNDAVLQTSSDAKAYFDENNFGDFGQTHEVLDDTILKKGDDQWIMATQAAIESIFPMPECSISYPSEEFRPPLLSEILEMGPKGSAQNTNTNTFWSERSLLQCFTEINQRPDTPARIICIPFAQNQNLAVTQEEKTKNMDKTVEESLSLEAAYTF